MDGDRLFLCTFFQSARNVKLGEDGACGFERVSNHETSALSL
jgi:hypothetical protein